MRRRSSARRDGFSFAHWQALPQRLPLQACIPNPVRLCRCQPVAPAQAGAQLTSAPNWAPACAGATVHCAVNVYLKHAIGLLYRVLGTIFYILLLTSHSHATEVISVLDDTGARVTLTRPANRIVSIAPHLTEQLFAIGAGGRIVATTEFADYPPAAQRLPRVARAHHVDLEQVAALQPDLIVLWGSGFPPAVQAALRRLNVPLFISEPRRLDDIADSMLRLGVLTAAPNAVSAAAAFRTRLTQLRTIYAQRKPLKVFYQVWPQPLMTLSGAHVVSEALTLCGGTNIFADLTPLAPHVSDEAVLLANPEVLMSAELGGTPNGTLDRWNRWPTLAAVQHHTRITLTAEHINRHGPRILDGVEEMCRALDAARGQ